MEGFAGTAVAALVILGGLTSPAMASAAAAPAAAPRASSCATHWGSKPKYTATMVRSAVLRVRAGQHACFDRLVIDLGRGGFPANGHELAKVDGFRTFRQVVGAGSFEGVSSVGLGVRARLPFSVLAPNGPGHQSRLVIDVAHHW